MRDHCKDVGGTVCRKEGREGGDLKDQTSHGPDVHSGGVITTLKEQLGRSDCLDDDDDQRGAIDEKEGRERRKEPRHRPIPDRDNGCSETKDSARSIANAAEVSEDKTTLLWIKEKVFGFDVAMHQTDVVEIGDSLDELEDEMFGVCLCPLKFELALADHAVRGGADRVVDVALHSPYLSKVHAKVFHHDKVRGSDGGGIVVRHFLLFHDDFKALEDVWMAQPLQTDDLSQHVIRKTIT